MDRRSLALKKRRSSIQARTVNPLFGVSVKNGVEVEGSSARQVESRTVFSAAIKHMNLPTVEAIPEDCLKR